MEREDRFKFIGIAFFLAIFTTFLVTNEGIEFIENFLKLEIKDKHIIFTVLGFIFTLFSSEAVGYLIGSVVYCCWVGPKDKFSKFCKSVIKYKSFKKYKWYGQYSHQYVLLDYNLRDEFIKLLNNSYPNLEKCSIDVIYSYFWMQAPDKIVDWVKRRHQAFLTSYSVLIAILSGLFLSLFTVWHYDKLNFENSLWLLYLGMQIK